VFPLAQHEGFRNLLPALLVDSGPHTSRVRVGDTHTGALLTVPRSALPPGAGVLVGVRADEIILALQPPAGISARNAVPATVTSVTDAGACALVSSVLAPGAPPLVAEVTAEAVQVLAIEPGTQLFLLLKTSAMVLYEEPPP
jgi:molybdate transport system ATP-binding protein